ncbi:MAG: hypothetical protein AAF518_20210 [Spirochaetota bacterium]
MSNVPIKHLYLYKHGIGFVKREGKISGQELILEFNKQDINDVLKSLYIIDDSPEGRILGIDYDIPEEKEKLLAKTSFGSRFQRNFPSFLNSIVGQQVKVTLKQENNKIIGILSSFQFSEESKELALITVLIDNGETLLIPLSNIFSFSFKDDKITKELKFILGLVNKEETNAYLLIRLNDTEHNLRISYATPSPTWKMSYRINTSKDNLLTLSGWCIFENTYGEDLNEISLTLTSGMPISFIYPLYHSNLPKRLQIKEEDRTIKNPIEFEENIDDFYGGDDFSYREREEELAAQQATMREAALRVMDNEQVEIELSPDEKLRKELLENLEESDLFSDSILENTEMDEKFIKEGQIITSAKEETFEYKFQEPVSVGRGQSAMIPLFSEELKYKKELIFNEEKYSSHPVFVIRFSNSTGYVLEAGPVTIFDNLNYSGESIIKISPDGTGSVLSYAVDLSIHIKRNRYLTKQIHSISFDKGNFITKVYHIATCHYFILNNSNTPKSLFVEHNKNKGFELFDTKEFTEETVEEYRFVLEVSRRSKANFIVKERFLSETKKHILNTDYKNVEKLAKKDFLDKKLFEKLQPIFDWKKEIVNIENQLADLMEEVHNKRDFQEDLRKNISALPNEENNYRQQMIEKLVKNDAEISKKEDRIQTIKKEAKNINTKIHKYLDDF